MWREIFFLLHPTNDHAPQDAFWVPLGGPQLLHQAVAYVPLAGLGVDRGVALALALVAHLQVEERGRSHFTSTTFFSVLESNDMGQDQSRRLVAGGKKRADDPTMQINSILDKLGDVTPAIFQNKKQQKIVQDAAREIAAWLPDVETFNQNWLDAPDRISPPNNWLEIKEYEADDFDLGDNGVLYSYQDKPKPQPLASSNRSQDMRMTFCCDDPILCKKAAKRPWFGLLFANKVSIKVLHINGWRHNFLSLFTQRHVSYILIEGVLSYYLRKHNIDGWKSYAKMDNEYKEYQPEEKWNNKQSEYAFFATNFQHQFRFLGSVRRFIYNVDKTGWFKTRIVDLSPHMQRLTGSKDLDVAYILRRNYANMLVDDRMDASIVDAYVSHPGLPFTIKQLKFLVYEKIKKRQSTGSASFLLLMDEIASLDFLGRKNIQEVTFTINPTNDTAKQYIHKWKRRHKWYNGGDMFVQDVLSRLSEQKSIAGPGENVTVRIHGDAIDMEKVKDFMIHLLYFVFQATPATYMSSSASVTSFTSYVTELLKRKRLPFKEVIVTSLVERNESVLWKEVNRMSIDVITNLLTQHMGKYCKLHGLTARMKKRKMETNNSEQPRAKQPKN